MSETNVKPMPDAKADWVARVLGIETGQGAAPAKGAFSLVALQKARLAWIDTRRAATAKLQSVGESVRAAVLAHNVDEDAEDEFGEADLEGGIEQLNKALDAFDEGLADALDEVLNAAAADRVARAAQARAVLARFRLSLDQNRILTAVEGSGFRANAVRSDLDAALKTVADALR